VLAKESQANEIGNPTQQISGRNEVHPVAFGAFESLAKQGRISADSFLPFLLRPTPERNAPAHHLLNHYRGDARVRDLRGAQSIEAISKRRHQAAQPLTNGRVNVGTSQTLWSIRYLVERLLFSREENPSLIIPGQHDRPGPFATSGW
jgi:hypothetical protein